MRTFIDPAAYVPLSQLPIDGTPVDAINNWQNPDVLLSNGRLLRPESA